jgi:hypothetical protein
VVGFTIGSRGKVPGKTCEKISNSNYNNNNNKYIFGGDARSSVAVGTHRLVTIPTAQYDGQVQLTPDF